MPGCVLLPLIWAYSATTIRPDLNDFFSRSLHVEIIRRSLSNASRKNKQETAQL